MTKKNIGIGPKKRYRSSST